MLRMVEEKVRAHGRHMRQSWAKCSWEMSSFNVAGAQVCTFALLGLSFPTRLPDDPVMQSKLPENSRASSSNHFIILCLTILWVRIEAKQGSKEGLLFCGC